MVLAKRTQARGQAARTSLLRRPAAAAAAAAVPNKGKLSRPASAVAKKVLRRPAAVEPAKTQGAAASGADLKKRRSLKADDDEEDAAGESSKLTARQRRAKQSSMPTEGGLDGLGGKVPPAVAKALGRASLPKKRARGAAAGADEASEDSTTSLDSSSPSDRDGGDGDSAVQNTDVSRKSFWERSGGRKTGRVGYTAAEDEEMRKWRNERPDLKASQLWKEAEAANVTRHGWQSMANRWRKKLAVEPEPDAAAPPAEGSQGAEPLPPRGPPARSPTTSSETAAARQLGRSVAQPPAASTTRATQRAAAPVVLTPRRAVQQARQSASRAAGQPEVAAYVEEAAAAVRGTSPAELAAEVMVRLLRQHAALGGEVSSSQTDFDGRWLFGNQVLRIVGRGTDLKVGNANCHFKPLTSNSCELFILDSTSSALLHVVSGRLSADLQSLEWSNGRVWRRMTEGEQDSRLLKDNNLLLTEEVRLLRSENQRLLGAKSVV